MVSALAALLLSCCGEAASSLSSPLTNFFQGRLGKGSFQGIGGDFSDEILDFNLNTGAQDFNLGLQKSLSSNFAGGVGAGLSHGSGSGFANDFAYTCKEGEVLNVDGKCTQPLVSKNVFVYDAPPIEPIVVPPPELPRPKVDFNIVFVRTPEKPKNLDPIVVPPPQKKTLVYVLSQNPLLEQDVIEVPPGPPQTPEVYYINYNKGDNPSLAGGVSLQEVLTSLKQQEGKLLGGAFGADKGILGLGNALGDKFITPEVSPGIYSAPSPVSLLTSSSDELSHV